MNVKEQIAAYIASQPEPKSSEMQTLHQHILKVLPKSKLWFLDGKDDKGKIVCRWPGSGILYINRELRYNNRGDHCLLQTGWKSEDGLTNASLIFSR